MVGGNVGNHRVEVPQLLNIRVAVLSAREEWRARVASQLEEIGVQNIATASPLDDIPPAAISIIDAAGVVPAVVGRPILALSDDAPPPINIASLRFPASNADLHRVICDEIGQLSSVGMNLDPEFRLAALETLFQLSTESVEFVDKKIQLLDVNHAFTDNTGHSLPAVIGKTTADLFRTGEVDPDFYREIDRALSSGSVWRGQLIARRKDGRISYQESILSPVLVRGDVAGFIAIKRDLDQDGLAAQAFASTNQRFESIVNSAADPIFLHDFTGRVFDCNISGTALLDLSGEDEEKNILAVFEEAIAKQLIRQWATLDRAQTLDTDCPLRATRDGEECVLSIRSGLVLVGGEKLIVTIGRDVTTRALLARALRNRTTELEETIQALKAAQTSLIAEENRAAILEERARSAKLVADRQLWFHTIFEGARDGMVIANRSGIIADVNQATLEFTNRDKISLIGTSIVDLFTDEGPKAIAHIIANIETSGSPDMLLELKMHRAMGEANDVSVNITRVVIDNEPHIHMVTRDIAVMKRAENERKQLEKRLRETQQLESLGTLAGGIAHDFNNLLGPIVAYSEMLEPFTAMDTEAEEMRQDIVTAGSRATDLVKRILNFSRRSERRVRTLYVAEVLSEVARLLHRTLPPGLSLVFGQVDVDARVDCDPTELHQVIMNLCTNAIHAMERDGGVLSLTIARVKMSVSFDPNLATDHLGRRDCVRISVADSGHGMTPEVRDRVFEPYFTTKTATRGTGLGLATVFGIIRDLSGTIRVQSEVSVGTQFDIYLPASAKTPEAILEVGTPSDIIDLGIGKVIVVDDEPVNIRILDRLLATFGAKVTGFTTPDDALSCLRKSSHDYDVLITDLTMPKMTGIELIRELRTFDQDLPVVVYTGYGDERSEAQAIAAGARMMIRKPVTQRVLLASLSVLVKEGLIAAARARRETGPR